MWFVKLLIVLTRLYAIGLFISGYNYWKDSNYIVSVVQVACAGMMLLMEANYLVNGIEAKNKEV